MFFFYNNDNDYDNDDDVGVVSITAAGDDDKFNVCYIKRNTTSLGLTEDDKKKKLSKNNRKSYNLAHALNIHVVLILVWHSYVTTCLAPSCI